MHQCFDTVDICNNVEAELLPENSRGLLLQKLILTCDKHKKRVSKSK